MSDSDGKSLGEISGLFRPTDLVTLGLKKFEVNKVLEHYVPDPELRTTSFFSNSYIGTPGVTTSSVFLGDVARITGRSFETLLADSIKINLVKGP